MESLIEVRVPQDDQEGSEQMIGTWFKQPGDSVKAHEPLLEINTDKVNVEVSAPVSGVLHSILKESGVQVQPGDVIAMITQGAAATTSSTSPRASTVHSACTQQSPLSTNGNQQKVPFEKRLSPAVKCLLKKHQLSPMSITGSGKHGRITQQDVRQFIELQGMSSHVASAPGGSTRITHTPMRKKIAKHMVHSLLETAPHVTTVFEADCTRIMKHRSHYKEIFAAEGLKLTLSAYFIKAAADALKAVPEVNSRWHDDALEIFSHCNIGIGTALDTQGLVVPVMRNVESMGLRDIAASLQAMTQKARQGNLTAQDMADGTFTISNHGVSGSLVATPIIINQPQSAILGIGKLEKRFKVEEIDGVDAAMIRSCCYVSLTIDHRVLDGFTANRFMQVFVDSLHTWPKP